MRFTILNVLESGKAQAVSMKFPKLIIKAMKGYDLISGRFKEFRNFESNPRIYTI